MIPSCASPGGISMKLGVTPHSNPGAWKGFTLLSAAPLRKTSAHPGSGPGSGSLHTGIGQVPWTQLRSVSPGKRTIKPLRSLVRTTGVLRPLPGGWSVGVQSGGVSHPVTVTVTHAVSVATVYLLSYCQPPCEEGLASRLLAAGLLDLVLEYVDAAEPWVRGVVKPAGVGVPCDRAIVRRGHDGGFTGQIPRQSQPLRSRGRWRARRWRPVYRRWS